MNTEILSIDPERPQAERIARAAAVLRAGGVVAFPTETVYGLGADALNPAAVEKIFTAKGRPSNNPLIVHVADLEAARRLVAAWPARAEQLTARLWPGPLTIVLPKAAVVPSIVTAGGPTVALRMPAHPVARALIAAAATPLAAPSANRSTRVSAVRAEHVVRGLAGRIEMVLDGGATHGGLESTVVDLSDEEPRILRPGLIDARALADALGMEVRERESESADDDVASALPSPGLLRKHYSPSVPVVLADDDSASRVRSSLAEGGRIGWMPLENTALETFSGEAVVCRRMPGEPEQYARRLYDVLHELETAGVSRIVVERPPPGIAWTAIHDRLRRAAAE